MKTFFRIVLVGSAVGLACTVGSLTIAQDKPGSISGAAVKGASVKGAAVPPVAAVPVAGEASPELKKAAEAVAKAMDRKECEKAFEFMTQKGEDEFIGSMLMQIASFAQADAMAGNGGGEVPGGLKELKSMAVELGIDKVPMPPFVPTGAPDDLDRMLKEAEGVREKLLACIPEKDRRKKVLALLEILSQSVASPMSIEVGSVEVTGDQADVALMMKLDPAFAGQVGETASGDGGEDSGPVDYMMFVKKDGTWKFDGLNTRRTMTQMAERMMQGREPFKAIENLSIEGKTVDDKAIGLADYKGKVVLVDFWGTWCGPCVASLPELSSLHEKYKSKGFEVLGVAADEADALKGFLGNKPLAWKHVVDAESEIATKHNIKAFPTTLLIDRQGKHVATNLHGETLTKAIELLLDGKTIESINGTAKDVLAAGQKQAAVEKKFVFLHFGASWCQPCQALEKWMAQPEIHKLLASVFVDVRIDTDLNFGASEMMGEFTQSDPGQIGIPFFAILNGSDSKPLMTSIAEKTGNIGLPDTTECLDHFVKMFESTGKFSKPQLELLRSSVQKVAKDLAAEKSK